MNWYKKIVLATARTLYHGTSIDNYDSIKDTGLVPDTGNFVSDAYSGEYYAAGVKFDPVDVTYATDKDDLGKAITAMMYSVSNMLGKEFHRLTLNELKNYGMLVIMKEGEEYMERRPLEGTGPWGDWQGETDNRYPTVELGDYFSEENQGPVEILVGNKMVEFLTRNGSWPISIGAGESIEEMRKQLLTIAIRYHIKENPEQRDRIIKDVTQKVNSLDDEGVKENYRLYSEKINELV